MMHLDESSLADRSSEELAHLAAAHLDVMHDELSAAAAEAREAWSPRSLARRHPVAAAALVAAVAAGGGLLIVRALRPRRRTPSASAAAQPVSAAAGPSPGSAAGATPSPGRLFTSALLAALAGAAGRAIPSLLLAIVDSQARKRL